MPFLNVTDVLTNRVNCSGSTFNLTLFLRSCARLARPMARRGHVHCHIVVLRHTDFYRSEINAHGPIFYRRQRVGRTKRKRTEFHTDFFVYVTKTVRVRWA